MNLKFRVYCKETNKFLNSDDIAISGNGIETAVYDYKLLSKDLYSSIFIGIKDKNGKDIYEGDLVNINNEIGTIVYYRTKFVCNFFKPFDYYSSYLESPFIEVIGNIYENSELLGV